MEHREENSPGAKPSQFDFVKTLKDVLDEAGVEETHWPEDHRLEPGEVVQDKARNEQTTIPVIRNDGKRYNGTAES